MTDAPIAVFGATGAQGAPVAAKLLAQGRAVRALARTPGKLQSLADAGAETVAIDLEDVAALTQVLEGVAGAFVHLPFVPVHDVIEGWSTAVTAALEAAEVPLTVFTLSGPVPTGPTGVMSMDTKVTADRIVHAAGVPVIRLEPMGYLANLSAPFSAPAVVDDDELRYPLPADHRQSWISVEDQAALAIAALERPDLAGRSYRIGDLYDGRQLAEGIGEGLDKRVRYVPITAEDFGMKVIAPVMGEEIGRALAHDYTVIAQRSEELRLEAPTDELHAALGLPATPLATWARSQDWESAATMGRTP